MERLLPIHGFPEGHGLFKWESSRDKRWNGLCIEPMFDGILHFQ